MSDIEQKLADLKEHIKYQYEELRHYSRELTYRHYDDCMDDMSRCNDIVHEDDKNVIFLKYNKNKLGYYIHKLQAEDEKRGEDEAIKDILKLRDMDEEEIREEIYSIKIEPRQYVEDEYVYYERFFRIALDNMNDSDWIELLRIIEQ